MISEINYKASKSKTQVVQDPNCNNYLSDMELLYFRLRKRKEEFLVLKPNAVILKKLFSMKKIFPLVNYNLTKAKSGKQFVWGCLM